MNAQRQFSQNYSRQYEKTNRVWDTSGCRSGVVVADRDVDAVDAVAEVVEAILEAVELLFVAFDLRFEPVL